MKKIFTFLLSAFVVSLSANAGTIWNVQDREFNVDTLQHFKIGPGTTMTKLKLDGPKKLRIIYTTSDLNNANLQVRAVKGQDRYSGGEVVSSMALRSSEKTGDLYFAGVNADFFSSGGPIGRVAVDGEIYRSDGAETWASFGISDDKQPVIAAQNEIICIMRAGGVEYPVHKINATRGENDLVLYSEKGGATTGTNAYGTEIALMPVDGKTNLLGRTVKMKAVSVSEPNKGSMAIPNGGFVLSGHGTSASIVASLAKDQKVEFSTWVKYDGVDCTTITQMVGGLPVILKDNQILETQNALDHLTSNHPRTAVGYNKKNQLVQMVVDGRSSISSGCTSKELAGFMQLVGCTEALNFDGGGSSTMYCGPYLGVQNEPSGGLERAVTDGLFLVTKGNQNDNAITTLQFKDAGEGRTVQLPQFGIYTPDFMGYNKSEILVNTKVEGVKLSLEGDNQKYGEIINNGTTLYVTAAEGSFSLTATYNGVKQSVPVVIKAGTVSFKDTKVLIDNYREFKVNVESSILENKMPLDNRALAWASENTDIATVDNGTGIVHGVANGNTTISGSLGDFVGKMDVTVEIPTAASMPVFYPTFPTDAVVKMLGGKGQTIVESEKGFKVTYTGTGVARGAYMTLEAPQMVWSLPESFRITVNPGMVTIKKISMNVENAKGERMPSWVFTNETLANNTNSTFILNLKEWCDIQDATVYPIKINSVRFDMGASKKDDSFTIDVPEFTAVYPQFGGVAENIVAQNAVKVYPNPVAMGERVNVAYEGHAVVGVYALNGAQVLHQEIDGNSLISTRNIPAGIYLIKVVSENETFTSKLIIK